MAEAAGFSVTRDTLLGGRLLLDQPSKGHRAGTDAILLAAAVPRGFIGHVCDAGAGVGTVGLAIALAAPKASITLVEREPALALIAGNNIKANGFEDRVAVIACDFCSPEAQAALPMPADLVVTNPPFYQRDRVRSSPDAARREAHVLSEGGLDRWLRACLSRLTARGSLILIHRADALPELLRLVKGRLGAITLLAVHPRADQPATRILLRGTRGSRAPLKIAPPLVLHVGDRFTPEAEQLHGGESALLW